MAEIRYQLDEHVSHAIARGLARRGIDVETAASAGIRGWTDAEILKLALDQGRCVVTHDRDFLRLARAETVHAGVFYSPQGLRTIGEILETLAVFHALIDSEEMLGRIEYL